MSVFLQVYSYAADEDEDARVAELMNESRSKFDRREFRHGVEHRGGWRWLLGNMGE